MSLYFIAIVAPANVNQHVLEWKKYMLKQYNCKKGLRSPAHITLIAPFNLRSELELSLVAALKEFARNQSKFAVDLKDFAFFAPRVIYVGVEINAPLQNLKTDVEDYLLRAARFPINKEERPFTPHITIASGDLKESHFPSAWAYFRTQSYQTVFEAHAISLLVATGTRWEVVAECAFMPDIAAIHIDAGGL